MSTSQRKRPEGSPAKETAAPPSSDPVAAVPPPVASPAAPRELGGPSGPDPTRFGDWEKNGRCIDF
jgi:hypothetical protein